MAHVVKGDLTPGLTVTVLSEPVESDVTGVVEDPNRVGDRRVVLNLDAPAQETSIGDAYFTTAPWQVGLSFAPVADDGVIVTDPYARSGIPHESRLDHTGARLSDADLVAAVRHQLQLDG